MIRWCPDCRKQFHITFLNEKGEDMLPDIIEHNPSLKIVCTPCGERIERMDWARRKLKK